MKTKIEINNRWTGKLLFEFETEENTMKKTVAAAIAASANLSDANLIGADLIGANLIGADLSRANLSRANLSRANLSRANLIGADLSRANLSRANLSRANLIGANLSDANLSRANLIGADLSRANLIGANLSDANLSRANLSRANLSRANLSDANLIGADLIGANLSAIKGDFLSKCMMQPDELEEFLLMLKEGRVDGESYEQKECVCFVGTLERLAKKHEHECVIPREAHSATEKWFFGIKTGDTPETNQISAITVQWLEELIHFATSWKKEKQSPS